MIQKPCTKRSYLSRGPRGFTVSVARTAFFFNVAEINLEACYPLMGVKYLSEEHGLLLGHTCMPEAVSAGSSGGGTI